MTMITPSYLGETIEYSSLHACRSTLEDPTSEKMSDICAQLEPFLQRIEVRARQGRLRWDLTCQACTETAEESVKVQRDTGRGSLEQAFKGGAEWTSEREPSFPRWHRWRLLWPGEAPRTVSTTDNCDQRRSGVC